MNFKRIEMETRDEAHDKVDKRLRYRQIIEYLNAEGDGTAKEIAVWMNRHKYTPTAERNFTAPRLTELKQAGVVEVCGKRTCKWTGRTVAVFRLAETEDEL